MPTNNQPVIPMEPVKSSQIAAIGHDPKTNTLAIQFKRDPAEEGSIYHYKNFTPNDFAAFKTAKSIGSHFHKHIKLVPDKYPYTKVSG